MDQKISKQLRINRINPDDIRPLYINDLIVTHTKNEFFVTFSQIELPAILTGEDIDKVDTVNAIAQCKIIMTPEFLPKLIEALQENYKKLQEED